MFLLKRARTPCTRRLFLPRPLPFLFTIPHCRHHRRHHRPITLRLRVLPPAFINVCCAMSPVSIVAVHQTHVPDMTRTTALLLMALSFLSFKHIPSSATFIPPRAPVSTHSLLPKTHYTISSFFTRIITDSPSNTVTETESTTGLPGALIAGIVILAIVIILLLVGLGCYFRGE